MKVANHPGPRADKRIDLHPCDGVPISLTLKAGIPLSDAIAFAMEDAGHDSVWLAFSDAAVDELAFVIPDDQPTEHTIVWYSETHSLLPPAKIEQIGITVGRNSGESFLHGHGLWRTHGGPIRMGHILPEETVLSRAVTAHGIALKGARFDRLPDPETGFSLFPPVAQGQSQSRDFALLRILPNIEFADAVAQACAALGWRAAKLRGLGSLIGATFVDGRTLGSFATEFLILDAETTCQVGEKPGADIAIIGVDADLVMTGRLSLKNNPVLVTAEVFLRRTL